MQSILDILVRGKKMLNILSLSASNERYKIEDKEIGEAVESLSPM